MNTKGSVLRKIKVLSMDIEEFEGLIEGGTETQKIDFKESCAWDKNSFAKDILAFSNVRGGGYIIVGIKEIGGRIERQGISDEHLETYNLETMLDQMSSYADPRIDIVLDPVRDVMNNKKYLIIVVREFQDIPVICKRDGREVKKGVIYYRNTDRRPESAPVSNSSDMRDIIELATVKRMKKFKELGLTVESSGEGLFDREVEEIEE